MREKREFMLHALEECFRRNPAFFFGCSLFVGVWLNFSPAESKVLNSLFSLFAAFFCLRPFRFLLGIALVSAAFFSTSFRVVSPPAHMVSSGTLFAEVTDRHIVTMHDKTSSRIDFFVHEFRNDAGTLLAKGIHVHSSASLPCKAFGGRLYQVRGLFSVDPSMQPRFRPDWGTLTEIGKTPFSFVEERVVLRKALEKIFVSLFENVDERIAAGALTFGLYKDPFLQHLMHNAGVEHVLAISGFHFGIVAALTLFFVNGMRPRFSVLIACILLTIYLLIVGPLPSVVRSWVAALVMLGGVFFGKTSTGLNCFGVGLIVASLFDPVSLTQVGCQLSFLATGAILLYSRHTLEWCSLFIRQKKVEEFVSFSFLDQCLTVILHRLFPAFSLIIPVWAVIVPYQLAFMPDISFLGIIYNMCVPLLFSLAMPCILLAVILFPIPVVSTFFAFIGALPLRCGLFLISAAPETGWSSMHLFQLSSFVLYFLVFVFFLIGCVLEGFFANERADAWKACV